MSRPIRVLHLVDSLKLGGIQTLLRDVLPALAVAGIDVRLASLHGPGPFSAIFSRHGIVPIHLASSKLNPVLPLRLWQLLRRDPVDILHTHGVPSCWLGERVYGLGLVPRLVQHVHHMYQGQHGQYLQNKAECFVYRRGDQLVACSQAVADSVETTLPTRVIYNGVDTAYFHPPTEIEREEARRKFGFSPEDHVLSMTGRITREKGMLRVCEALSALAASYPRLKLLVAGKGPDEEAVRAYCEAAGLTERVVMAGFQEDVRPCLHAADTYIMASAVEGLGTALLEAMSTGLPAVVADYPAALEVVSDGLNARLFCRDKQGSLEKVLGKGLEVIGEQRSLGEQARATVVERFSISSTVGKFLALYEEL